jgi:hypothetical protein
MAPPVQWVTPSPLWETVMKDPGAMQRPAVLRFASDTFMQDLADQLQLEPSQLHDYIAVKQSFRAPPLGADASWIADLPNLKLYQPAHGHFYLVAANLVCRLTGLPDRILNAKNGESVGFVLRRLDSTGAEMAWVDHPAAATGWQPLPSSNFQSTVPGEQLLPLFSMNFSQSDRRRRLLVGLIPVASRETFQASAALSPFVPETDASGQPRDPRLNDLETRVTLRLSDLHDNPPFDATRDAHLVGLQAEGARFILLDLAAFLQANLPGVWQALVSGLPPSHDRDQTVFTLLANATVDDTDPSAPNWVTALLQAWSQRDAITGETDGPPSTLSYGLRYTNLDSSALSSAVAAALNAPSRVPPVASPPPVPKLDPGAGALYVLRCVFRRPLCAPPLNEVVSQPTEEFELASFFDFDAPGRPIRIPLPIDTSPGGLRKFNKNVGFIISKQLDAQISRATDLNKLLKGDLADGQTLDIGWLCSFSIPIITICAMIVLMIFVNLLNIIFWWMPFLRICLPIVSPRPK